MDNFRRRIDPYLDILRKSINDIKISLNETKNSTDKIVVSNQDILDKTFNNPDSLKKDIHEIKGSTDEIVTSTNKILRSTDKIVTSNQDLLDKTFNNNDSLKNDILEIKSSTDKIVTSNQDLLDKTFNNRNSLKRDIKDIKSSTDKIVISNQQLLDITKNKNKNITNIWEFILKNIELFTIWGIFGAILIGLETIPDDNNFKTIEVTTSTLAFLFISYKLLFDSLNIKLNHNSIKNLKMDFIEFIVFEIIFISFIIGLLLFLGNPVSQSTAVIMYIYFIILFVILIIVLLKLMSTKKGIEWLIVLIFETILSLLTVLGIIFIINIFFIHDDKLNAIIYLLNMAIITDFQITVIVLSLPLLYFIIKNLQPSNNLQVLTDILNNLKGINFNALFALMIPPIVIIILAIVALWFILVPQVTPDPITGQSWNNTTMEMNITFYQNNSVCITNTNYTINGQWNKINKSYYIIDTPIINSIIGERQKNLIYLNDSGNKSMYFIDDPNKIFSNSTSNVFLFNSI